MVVYYSSCLLSMAIAWLFTLTKSYKKGRVGLAVFFSALPLFLVAALRYGIGTDYKHYVNIYSLAENGIKYKSEISFNIITFSLVRLGLSSQWLFVVFSVLFCVFTYLALFKESPYPVLSVFLLVGMTHYFAFLNIMRQMTAASIVLYGYSFIEKRNLKKYILFVLIASSLHYMCIVFLPIYWIKNIQLKPHIIIILTGILLFIGNYIEEIVLLLVGNSVYSWYVGSKYDTGSVGYMYIALQLVIDIFLLFTFKNNIKYKTLFNTQILNTWISFFSGKIVLVERFRYLLGFPCIILIPLGIYNIKNKTTRFLTISFVVVMFTIYSYLVTTSGNHEVLPYTTIFKKSI